MLTSSSRLNGANTLKKLLIRATAGLQSVGCAWLDSFDIHTKYVYSTNARIDSLPTSMNKRLNIMMPEKTLAVLDRVTSKGNRSRFISHAVLHFLKNRSKHVLRDQLKAGYQANAEDSLKLALGWFPLEEEAWQKSHARRIRKK